MSPMNTAGSFIMNRLQTQLNIQVSFPIQAGKIIYNVVWEAIGSGCNTQANNPRLF